MCLSLSQVRALLRFDASLAHLAARGKGLPSDQLPLIRSLDVLSSEPNRSSVVSCPEYGTLIGLEKEKAVEEIEHTDGTEDGTSQAIIRQRTAVRVMIHL